MPRPRRVLRRRSTAGGVGAILVDAQLAKNLYAITRLIDVDLLRSASARYRRIAGAIRHYRYGLISQALTAGPGIYGPRHHSSLCQTKRRAAHCMPASRIPFSPIFPRRRRRSSVSVLLNTLSLEFDEFIRLRCHEVNISYEATLMRALRELLDITRRRISRFSGISFDVLSRDA